MTKTRACSSCDIEKPESEYSIDRSNKIGRKYRCKVCDNKAAAIWRNANKKIINKKSNARRIKAMKEDRLTHDIKRSYANSVNRAKKINLDHNISISYLLDMLSEDKSCPICGVMFDDTDHSVGRRNNAISLDRLTPSKGYVRGNVDLMCFRCNQIKNAGSALEHRMIADYIDRKLNETS